MSITRITPLRFVDSRGWFSESWNAARFNGWGVDYDWIQDNHSYSRPAGTLRGLHFQREPAAQTKLVRCLRGRIYDVAVDIRPASPTYKQWVGVELSADNGAQLLIPRGYAHGFLTLEPDCEVAYKVDAPYAPDSDGGVAWNDPEINIDWPLSVDISAPCLSDKDAELPNLVNCAPDFSYDGIPLTLRDIKQ
jgi:dTDP-4-dehydrorhamnose 3,5-epimerase